MADHALSAAVYALKVLQAMGQEIDAERQWQRAQLQQLRTELAVLVLRHLPIKEKGIKAFVNHIQDSLFFVRFSRNLSSPGPDGWSRLCQSRV